jgi:hypothetical protein
MLVAIALVIVAALAWSAAKEGNMDSKNPKDVASVRGEVPRITPKQAAERAFRAAAEPLSSTLAEFTPPLPLHWPPVGDRSVVYFAYPKVPLPTGTDLYEVHTPFLRVEITLDVTDTPKSSVTRLDSRLAHFPERSNVMDPSSAVMEQAADVLFDAVCRKPEGGREPTGAAADTLRTAYRKWLAEHQSVGKELRASFPRFFEWIESNQ